MKIIVISDTHIPERANKIPRQVIDVIKKADMLVHAGDFVDLSVLDLLKEACPNLKAVWGNMDNFKIKKTLPEKEIFRAGKYNIGIMHGFGPPGKLIEFLSDAFKNDTVDVIIFGHSHQGHNQRIGDILFFNPGSLTDEIFSSYNSYGIIQINDEIEASIVKL